MIGPFQEPEFQVPESWKKPVDGEHAACDEDCACDDDALDVEFMSDAELEDLGLLYSAEEVGDKIEEILEHASDYDDMRTMLLEWKVIIDGEIASLNDQGSDDE